MNEAPKTEEDLERYLRRVERLKNSSDFPAALEACLSLVEKGETRAAGLRARADIYADMRQRELELADREALADIGTGEPGDYFDLGVCQWRASRSTEAIASFFHAIELGEDAGFHYYTNAARMHLAALLIQLNRRKEALSVCILIPKDYSSYLPGGVMTREQLLEGLDTHN